MVSAESMLRFRMPILRNKMETKTEKEQKSGFQCSMDEVFVELSSSAEDNSKREQLYNGFCHLPQVRQPSLQRQSTQLLVY